MLRLFRFWNVGKERVLAMEDLRTVIPVVRDSVVAILRIRTWPDPAMPGQWKFDGGWGTGFCIVENRYLMTAAHNLGLDGVRDPADRYYAFTVPGNGDQAFFTAVRGIVLDRPDIDIAILEIDQLASGHAPLPALPISFQPQADGERVVTVGFPNPEVVSIGVDQSGAFSGGDFFLRSHANEGIVAAQYRAGPTRKPLLEFNVAWNHGESGGPVTTATSDPAVLTLMQDYRNILTPRGDIHAGPRRGVALAVIEPELRALGVRVV